MSSKWVHDSSGISSLDTIHSAQSHHLSRSAVDRHIWAFLADHDPPSSSSAAPTARPTSLCETLLHGLLRHPQLVQQMLGHLPAHLIDALLTNIKRVWPPSSLTQTSCPAPFALWLHQASHHHHHQLEPYDGLVLRDTAELASLPAFSILTSLDLVDAQLVDDALCIDIKNAVGKSLRALRLSSLKLTDLGIRKLTASLPDNFDQLILVSFYGSRGVTDRAMPELLKFPRLACIDLRGTSATSASASIASRSPSPFQSAPRRDRTHLIRPDKPLIHSCQELERLLRLASPRKAALTRIARHMQLSSKAAAAAAEERRAKALDTFTPALGHCYSTSALSRDALLQDATELTAKGKAFRSNYGGEVAAGRVPSSSSSSWTQSELGLLECLRCWSDGQWASVLEGQRQGQRRARVFKSNTAALLSEDPDNARDETARLLDGPVLLRKLPPPLPPPAPVEHSSAKPGLVHSHKRPKLEHSFERPHYEAVVVRPSCGTSHRSSASSSLSLLGFKDKGDRASHSSEKDSRTSKRARLDQILPPSRTESPGLLQPPPTGKARRAPSQSQSFGSSMGGTPGQSLGQKRSHLGAFRKSNASFG